MSPVVKLLAAVILIYFPLLTLAIQEVNPEVAWYENFFENNNKGTVERNIKEITTRLNQATKAKNAERQARALKELALTHLTQTNDYEVAMDLLIQCLAIEDSLDLQEQRIFTYLAMAQVFEEVGNYDKSEQLIAQALSFNEATKNPHIEVLILNKLGQIKASSGKMLEAFRNYEQVLEYKNIINNPKAEAQALFNIADIYSKQGIYNRSLQTHRSALAIRRVLKDKSREAISLNEIGELYRRMRNDGRALANHRLALKIRQNLNDKRGMAESFNNIGLLYYQQKKYVSAIASLNAGLKAALESQTLEQQQKSYDFLSLTHKELGEYEEALMKREQFVVVSDFIQNQKNDQRLLESQSRYVIDTKESQIESLEVDRQKREQQLHRQKNLRNFLISLIALGLIIVGLILKLYKVKQRSHARLQEINERVNHQNLQLQELNATKDKFFSIIGHDLKGPLNSLTSFSGLLINHTDSLSKEEIQMLAKDFDKSLKNLLALLNNLLEWSRSQTGNIEFKPETFDITSLLKENKELLCAQAQIKKISFLEDFNGKVLVTAHKHSLNTVVRNLISNSIKFTTEGGLIKLGVKQNQSHVLVTIADTGVGMSPEVIDKLFRIDAKHTTKGTADEKGTGLGLILCKDFVEKNGGKLWVESEPDRGSVFYFSVPLTN
ncbi:tetratricopeptide repeat-containing sensor histidine kinase [Chryseolinea sp. H1M3-3]|uniref:ATP-binding protein n=1 Tax=Chryseolinea sp. H1M3-3 TaxID=3034144 RepID=UPI0023EDF026|nr:tetratricopeptide repeat-containing sensor histidine kinase [Chryseolinea sp. H1M3-3]